MPKISYVELFKPWNWVVGTGVYIDDVEEDTKKRFDAVISELRQTFSRAKLAKTGYMYIFTGDKKMLIHPRMEEGTDISERIDSLTNKKIFDELIQAAKTPSVPLEYAWDREENGATKTFHKRAYVRHFEPLDWYICASFSDEDIAIPAKKLQGKILFLSSLILVAAILFAVLISKSLIKPLKDLTLAAKNIEREGIHSAEIPVSGTSETIELGTILNRMLASIKNSEHELTRTHSYIDNIINSMPSVLIGVDTDDKVTLWNSKAQRISGLPSAEAVGQPLPEVFPPLAAEIERVHEAMLTQEVQSDPRQARMQDDETRYEDVTVYPLLTEGVEGAVIRVDDVTERERLIAKLENQNAELERFTYTVSHDLKSPLITITGFVGMLRKDLEEENAERVEHDLSRIYNAATKMDQLLRDLLELSRIGRLVNPPEKVPLEELAREALELVGGQIKENKVQVVIHPDLPSLYGDRIRLIEVLQNLIDNAVKYIGNQPRPRVEIGSRRKGTETVYYVSDNGIGIDPQYHEKIFGLFDQLNPKIDGSGIGLSLARRIVKVHGGRIWVESDGPGHGSTFCFTVAGKNDQPHAPRSEPCMTGQG